MGWSKHSYQAVLAVPQMLLQTLPQEVEPLAATKAIFSLAHR
jgi:hypothetical protein